MLFSSACEVPPEGQIWETHERAANVLRAAHLQQGSWVHLPVADVERSGAVAPARVEPFFRVGAIKGRGKSGCDMTSVPASNCIQKREAAVLPHFDFYGFPTVLDVVGKLTEHSKKFYASLPAPPQDAELQPVLFEQRYTATDSRPPAVKSGGPREQRLRSESAAQRYSSER